MMLRQKIASTIVFVVLLTTSSKAIELKTKVDVVHALGVEIAEMRNMFATYVMVAVGIKYKNPQERLKQSINQMEDLARAIKTNYKEPAVVDAVDKGLQSWSLFKNSLSLVFDNDLQAIKLKKNAKSLQKGAVGVVSQLDEMQKHFIKTSDVNNANLYGAALRIAVSARGFATVYMMKMWGLTNATTQKFWHKLTKEYKDSIAVIRESAVNNNEQAKKSLDTFEKNYIFYDNLFNNMGGGKYMPSLMDKKTSHTYDVAMELAETILDSK